MPSTSGEFFDRSPSRGLLGLGFARALRLGCLSFCFRLEAFISRLLSDCDGDGLVRHEGHQSELALAEHGHDAGDVVAHLRDLARVLELADGVLEAELVELSTRGLHAVRQLVLFQLPELVDFHPAPPVVTDSELTNLVLMGSFDAASFIASLATCCVTPPISKRMRPGLTTATQPSGLPLPEPMRVSAGFFVIDLSGKTRIQICPPRLTCRVIALRAASIWRLLIQHASTACSP